MKQLFLCTSLISVLALACSALAGDNRYGGHYNGNSHRSLGGYSAGPHSRGHFGAPSAPGIPRAPGAPGAPQRPAPPAYGGARHFGAPAGPAPYSAPSHFNAPAQYGAPSHGLRRSVYQPQQPAHGAAARLGGNNYPQQHSTYQQSAQSKSQTHGREMKYTINDPHNRGQTHVTETHVVSNRQMHGAEAEAAMKKLMGSMGGSGPSYGSDAGFQNFVKGMGLPFY